MEPNKIYPACGNQVGSGILDFVIGEIQEFGQGIYDALQVTPEQIPAATADDKFDYKPSQGFTFGKK